MLVDINTLKLKNLPNSCYEKKEKAQKKIWPFTRGSVKTGVAGHIKGKRGLLS